MKSPWQAFAMLILASPLAAQPVPGIPLTTAAHRGGSLAAESIEALLREAQTAYDHRADASKAEESVRLWESALKKNPSNYEALWKLSRAWYWIGNHAPENERLKSFTKGKEYAERAVKVNPAGVDGHYWLGINLGRYGENKGILKSLVLIKPIRAEMEAVLSLDKKHAGAHHVLGVLYRKSPGKPISIGSKKKALWHAKKAVELDTSSLRYAIGLAEAEAALDHKEEAKRILNEVLRMPPNIEYIPESLEDKEEAQRLLKELEK